MTSHFVTHSQTGWWRQLGLGQATPSVVFEAQELAVREILFLFGRVQGSVGTLPASVSAQALELLRRESIAADAAIVQIRRVTSLAVITSLKVLALRRITDAFGAIEALRISALIPAGEPGARAPREEDVEFGLPCRTDAQCGLTPEGFPQRCQKLVGETFGTCQRVGKPPPPGRAPVPPPGVVVGKPPPGDGTTIVLVALGVAAVGVGAFLFLRER